MLAVTSGHASQLSYTPKTETEKCKARKGNKHISANATHCLTVSCARPLNSSFRFSASCSDSWVPRSSCSVFSNSLETSPSFFVTSSNRWVIMVFCLSVSSSLSLVSFSWVIALAACFSRLSKSLARVWKITTEFYLSSLMFQCFVPKQLTTMRSKHIKGSKGCYPVGWNTICKFWGQSPLSSYKTTLKQQLNRKEDWNKGKQSRLIHNKLYIYLF